jgi:hypothetical protein
VDKEAFADQNNEPAMAVRAENKIELDGKF